MAYRLYNNHGGHTTAGIVWWSKLRPGMEKLAQQLVDDGASHFDTFKFLKDLATNSALRVGNVQTPKKRRRAKTSQRKRITK